MSVLPSRARSYLFLLVAGVLLASGALWDQILTLSDRPLVAGAFLVAMLLALGTEVRVEVRAGHAVGLTVLEAVLLVMITALGPGGIAVVIAGAIGFGLIRRRPAVRTVGNAAMLGLEYAFSAMVYQAFHPAGTIPFTGFAGGLTLILTAAAIYLSNTLLVGSMIAFASGQSLVQVWRNAVQNTSWITVFTFALGALAAAAYQVNGMLALYAALAMVLAVRAFQAVVAVQAEIRQREHLAEERARLAEQVAAQQRDLARAERLSMIGTVASSMAHEVRNALAAIIGNADVGPLLSATADKHQLFTLIGQIGRRTNMVMESILTFARERPPVLTTARLQPVIADVVAMVESDLQVLGIALQCDVDPAAPPAVCDPTQMSQVLVNLLSNARDACKAVGHGAIKIRLRAAETVELAVSDTGAGMAPEVVAQIFVPFATTKPHGTGLGMAICESIVRNHHGQIAVESAVGAGTTVTILLPCARPAAEHDADRSDTLAHTAESQSIPM